MTLTFQTRSERPARCVAVIDSALPLVFVLPSITGGEFVESYHANGRRFSDQITPGDILGLTPEIVAGLKEHFNQTNL